jgi:hypothetical protein
VKDSRRCGGKTDGFWVAGIAVEGAMGEAAEGAEGEAPWRGGGGAGGGGGGWGGRVQGGWPHPPPPPPPPVVSFCPAKINLSTVNFRLVHTLCEFDMTYLEHDNRTL